MESFRRSFSNKKDQIYTYLKHFRSFPDIHAENYVSILKLVNSVKEYIWSVRNSWSENRRVFSRDGPDMDFAR